MNLPINHQKLLEMNLKRLLRYYLDLRQMTAAELARRSHISPQTISNWLNGGVAKDINKVKQVADSLGTTLDNLIYGSGLGSDQAVELRQILADGHTIKGLFEVEIKMVRPK